MDNELKKSSMSIFSALPGYLYDMNKETYKKPLLSTSWDMSYMIKFV